MKKLLSGLLVLLLLALGIFCYHSSFPIPPDQSNLREELLAFYTRGHETSLSAELTLYDSVTLGSTQHLLLELNGQLGQAILTRGLTGGYKIESLGYGTANFRRYFTQEQGKHCLLFGGRNPDTAIASISFQVDGIPYTLDLPASPTFFLSVELEQPPNEPSLDWNYVRFFNSAGEDITDSVGL